MSQEDIAKLRAYIAKNHKYDFKQPIKAFVYETVMEKETKYSASGKKFKESVEKKIKTPCEIVRAVISFVPCDNPPKLLYMFNLRGDTLIKSEEEFTFK